MPTLIDRLSAEDDPNRASELAGNNRIEKFRALLRKAGMTKADIEIAIEIAHNSQNPDRVIMGATAIAREAHLFKDNGEPDDRRAYYLLEQGLLPGQKVGNQWSSTPRLVRNALIGGAVEQAAERAAAAAARRKAKAVKVTPPPRRLRKISAGEVA
jgi:hypothetical protein